MDDTPDRPANVNGLEQNESSAKAQASEADQSKAMFQAVADLKAENADLRDKNLRIIAEMENFRRRAERDKTESMKYAASEFGRDMIAIADNLRRAIEAVPKEAVEQNPGLKTLIEGVEVTERELFKAFERHGITRFDPLGEKFDPHKHEAVVKVDVPNVPADMIVQVLQAGYKIAHRILRPATVILAKGSPAKAEPGPQGGSLKGGGGPEAHAADSNSAQPHDHSLELAHEHDADVVRDPAGPPKTYHGHRGRPAEKRSSTVTQPVTGGRPIKKDDMISSFGKRLESGS